MKIDKYPEVLLDAVTSPEGTRTWPFTQRRIFGRLFPEGLELTKENLIAAFEERLDIEEIISGYYNWDLPEGLRDSLYVPKTDWLEEKKALLQQMNDQKRAASQQTELERKQALSRYEQELEIIKAKRKENEVLADVRWDHDMATARAFYAQALANTIIQALEPELVTA